MSSINRVLNPHELVVLNVQSPYIYVRNAEKYITLEYNGHKFKVTSGASFNVSGEYNTSNLLEIKILNENAVDNRVYIFESKTVLREMWISEENAVQKDILQQLQSTQNIISAQATALLNILNSTNTTNTKLDILNTTSTTTNAKLDEAKTKLDNTNSKLDEAKTKLDTLNTTSTTTNTKLDEANAKLEVIKNELS